MLNVVSESPTYHYFIVEYSTTFCFQYNSKTIAWTARLLASVKQEQVTKPKQLNSYVEIRLLLQSKHNEHNRTNERTFLQKISFNFLQLHISYGFWTEALVNRISPPIVKYWLYLNTATQGETEVKNLAYHITLCNTALKSLLLRLQRTDLQ